MATNWQIGDRIQDRWEIHRILHGGMGIVYVVYDHEWHEAFAAKTFQDEIFARNPAIVDLFMVEARTWINLDIHQNVVWARFAEKIGGKPFLFLEYVSGGDMSSWIGTPRLTKDLPQVLRFAIQFCDGMGHALSKGIEAHRDIKPQNCLITEEGTLNVTDFGLAKVIAVDERSGGIGGTLAYMAPEQWGDFAGVDVRADIYSFGVMLFQMMTGQLPFVGQTRKDLERQHKTQPPPVISSQHSSLNAVVEDCLAKDPAHRIADFALIRERLAEIYERLTGGPAPQPVTGHNLDAEMWFNKGVSLYRLGQANEALTCYDRALEINSRLEQALYNKGVTLGMLGRSDEAFSCLDRALEINPHLPPAWTIKGNALSALGQVREALVHYDRALDLNPHEANTWNNKGNALNSLGEYAEALACFDRALELNPHFELAWSNKGGLLHQLGKYEQALVCYEEALELDRYHDVRWFNKGTALSALGRTEEALACYDQALEINPCFERVWTNKGNLLSELGRPEEALVCYDQALKLNPLDAMAWFNLGVTLSNCFRRYREAFACFEEAHRLGHPQAASVITQLGPLLRQ